mgnify:CR=1 FL=1
MKTTEAVTSGVSSSRLTGWRPAWEGWSAAAGFAAAGTTAAMVPGWWGAGLASVLALMGVVRTAEALRTASRRIPLAGFAPAFIHAGDLIRILREKGMDEKKAVDPARKTARERLVARYEAGRIALLDSMRFNAGREGRLVKNLWIGRGFEWTPAHAQALYELAATPVKPVIVPKRIRKALSLPDPLEAGDIGSPIIHGIGATEEDDIVRPLSSLGGGTLIVGTTQAGKGVMLTSLVTQAILRGEPVIVIDPKSSKRLRNAVWKAAEIAGRPAPLEFHPAFPETGVRLDPLGAWTRPTELATRIAAVMPPDSGAFGNFNNLIALRSKDRLTQEFICETFGKTTVWSTSASLSSSADGSPVPDFRASVTRSIQGRRDEVVPPDVLGRLPNTEFFASVSGGRLYKGRIPILLSDD